MDPASLDWGAIGALVGSIITGVSGYGIAVLRQRVVHAEAAKTDAEAAKTEVEAVDIASKLWAPVVATYQMQITGLSERVALLERELKLGEASQRALQSRAEAAEARAVLAEEQLSEAQARIDLLEKQLVEIMALLAKRPATALQPPAPLRGPTTEDPDDT